MPEVIYHEYPEDRVVEIDKCQYGWPEPCVNHPVFAGEPEYDPKALAEEVSHEETQEVPILSSKPE